MNAPMVEIECVGGQIVHINPMQVASIEDAPKDSNYASVIILTATIIYSDGNIRSIAYMTMLTRGQVVEEFNAAMVKSTAMLMRALHEAAEAIHQPNHQ